MAMEMGMAMGMGREGEYGMAGDSFLEYVLDQLRGLDRVETRAMFGAHGLYQAGVFFGIVHDGRLYFKTDEESRAEYEQRGMAPFRPSEKQTLKNYYELPVDVLEDDEALCLWALRACRSQS
jgi:DNA transformation protein